MPTTRAIGRRRRFHELYGLTEGFVTILDRAEAVRKSGSVGRPPLFFEIYPKDLEEIAARHPAVAEVAVFGVPDDKWGETPVAAVVLKTPGAATSEELRDWINARVGARYQRVKEVTLREAFPRNAAGKTLKRDLREPYWAGKDRKI